jgi:hypothetical protein
MPPVSIIYRQPPRSCSNLQIKRIMQEKFQSSSVVKQTKNKIPLNFHEGKTNKIEDSALCKDKTRHASFVFCYANNSNQLFTKENKRMQLTKYTRASTQSIENNHTVAETKKKQQGQVIPLSCLQDTSSQ